ncbi:hypothetical protein [Hymenobacter jejuensis]|uniref:Acyloxyacyl hydrolase n=1 Tax=Hymenobacter jejuensis TaxID=2502781 RepID=A0A5B7ZZ42_9BACT|nr:hypothetical protein [Hymenobacter jejuensis]QDA60119.1 hypothetical protein FHG12_08360 [Hymenobacter jejuensis]
MRRRTEIQLLAILILSFIPCFAHAQAEADVRRSGPFFLTVQLAGGQGVVAVGGGYWLADRRLEPEVLVGYVPRSIGGSRMAVFTFKTTYTPFEPKLGGRGDWRLNPVSVGGFLNYTTGKQFFLTNDSAGRYPKGYYWWSSAVRLGAFAGLRLTHHSTEPNLHGWPRRTSFYSELSTNDLHLVSALTNKTLRIPEILTLGLGVKNGW